MSARGDGATPITIAYITSVTGEGASEMARHRSVQSRVDCRSRRGVNGHKIVPLIIDDQTSDAIATAVQRLIQGVCIVSQSRSSSSLRSTPSRRAFRSLVRTATSEWASSPTPTCSPLTSAASIQVPVTTLAGTSSSSMGPRCSPLTGTDLTVFQRAAIQTSDSFNHAGGKTGVLDTTVRSGCGLHQRSAVGEAESHRCVCAGDGQQLELRPGSSTQAGGREGDRLFATGYSLNAVHSAAWSAVQGSYFYSLFALVASQRRDQADAGGHGEVRRVLKTDFPSFSEYEPVGRGLMIKDCSWQEESNPTGSSRLRGVKSYNANGLLPKAGITPRTSGTTMPRAARGDAGGKNGFTPYPPSRLRNRHPGTARASSS